ncbi:Peptidase family M28 [Streptomyces sp. DvalAA-14]|uniref:M28 family peptidase n=1 Tax=unclassified Streptomyces TaxID=2593676 RepID=UPI00081B6E7B|nr:MULTISPECIES: M28 family peptidase [unclassified Streptomyces]MYS24254.1 M28 family peptidase [Streptomyces sp. SID4948]SCE44260.1 Peptidase family M28 [Streptomyces sp. DvalAA-14]
MPPIGPAGPELLRRHVAALARGPRSRRHAPRAMEEAEEYVTGVLRAAGWQVAREPFDARLRLGSTDRHGQRAMPLKVRLHRGLSGANLRAELPGSRPTGPGGARPPTLVVGAHLDTVQGSPGADDNASGVAVVLEVARLLGGLAAPPPVTLMVFDMEELGLIGAREAVRRLLGEAGRTLGGMICLESVGFFSDEPGSQRLPAGAGAVMPEAVGAVRRSGHRGDFTLIVHRNSSRTLAAGWARAAAAASPALPTVLLRDPRPDGPLGAALGLAVPALGNLDRSDHSPFWNHRVPAVMLTGTANFRNAEYHRPGDLPDTLDYARLAAVATATAVTAASWPEAR